MSSERERPPAGAGLGSVAAGRFREVFGHLPTGVTVVTAHGEDGPVGMAANSVTSVSLDPPMLLLCPAKSSTTWPAIRAVGRFCVNVMAGHQAEVSRRFAERGVDRYQQVTFGAHEAGPILDGALAWVACELRDEHDAGDHTIVVADVVALEISAEGDPLIFFRGRYGTFSVPG